MLALATSAPRRPPPEPSRVSQTREGDLFLVVTQEGSERDLEYREVFYRRTDAFPVQDPGFFSAIRLYTRQGVPGEPPRYRVGPYAVPTEVHGATPCVPVEATRWPDRTPASIFDPTPAQLFIRKVDQDYLYEAEGLSPAQYELELEDLLGNVELEGVRYATAAVFVNQQTSFPAGAGVGRRVMRGLTRLADALGVTLYHNPCAQIHVDPAALSQDSLEAWHRRLGYEFRPNFDHVMVRHPRKDPSP